MSQELAGVPAEPLRRFCERAFEQAGMAAVEAALLADTLVEADLRGVHSHGTWWTTTYSRRLRHGGLNPRAQLRIVRDAPAVALLDGDGGAGQVASVAAMRLAMEKARANGAGVCAVRNSNHFGAAAYYAMMAAEAGLIGFATTDSEPTMAPWGGRKLVMGNNPLAFAIPTGDEFTIVLDMAQSVVAWGKIFLAAQRGEQIPIEWALDAAGEPTTDPAGAMAGFLMPVGGYKGYGLALIMAVLSGVLSGSNTGASMPPMEEPAANQGHGHFFLALDVEQFVPRAEFQQRLALLMAEQREAPRAPGVERIYLPGEIEHEKRKRYRRSGIPLEPAIRQALGELGQELGLQTGFLDSG